MSPKKPEGIALDQYQQEFLERSKDKAAEKAAKHRGVTLSLKFRENDVETWRAAAEASGVTLTEWVESGLNKLAERCLK